jgi:hypothetical protein
MKKHYITTLLCLTVLTLSHAVWAQDFAYVPPPLSELHVNDRKELKMMLVSLEQQFDVYFAFESQVVRDKYIPGGVKTTENLEETLFQLLTPYNLRFKKISEKFYIIYSKDEVPERKRAGMEFGVVPINQNYRPIVAVPVMPTLPLLALTVTRTVKDENNMSLPGVKVLEKGTTNGTTTDASGNYSLNVQDEKSVLIYSFIGYTSQEVMVNGRSIIDVSLVPSVQSLQEVVVIGYGTVERKDLTGAVGSIGDLFNFDNEHHSEYIFDIEYIDGNVGLGSPFTRDFLVESQDVGTPFRNALRTLYNIQGPESGGGGTPTLDFIALFDPADLRKYRTATTSIVDADGNTIAMPVGAAVPAICQKYNTSIITDGKANWRVFRYADILLMLAEAMNENGKTPEALEYLNQVRNRAGLADYSGLTQAEARDKIYLERRFELYLEGHRWFDLLRTGRALEVMAPFGMKPHMTVFPIPQSQIEVVNDPAILSQNPGY